MTNGVFSLYYSGGEHLCSFVKKSDCHFETIINGLNNFFIELQETDKKIGGRLNWEYVAVKMITFFDKNYIGGGVKMISGPPSELDRSHITEFHITPILGKYERNSCNILDAVHIKLKWSSGEIHKEGILSDLIENVSVEY